MNRGRRGEEIFSDKKDYEAFVVLLRETGEMFDFQVSAYCLMRTEHLMSQSKQLQKKAEKVRAKLHKSQAKT